MPFNPFKIDLTTPDSFGVVDDAVFEAGFVERSGTGLFNTFVQIQHNGIEQGYNTSAAVHQFDEQGSAQFNHSLLLANVPIVIGDGTHGTVEGVAYRQFVLDINEAANRGLLSLDKLQIWQEESGSLTGFAPGAGFAGTHTNYLAYDLDAGGDTWIALNSGLSSGSGKGDMTLLVPDSDFINDAAHRYVTLYSAFGYQAGYAADGGFEEWGVTTPNGGPGTTAAFAVHKTATVPGGSADHAGEVITYTIQVDNVGDKGLTGLTVNDPSVSDLAGVDANHDGFNDGDTNHDGQLSVGETWTFTAHHTVTQAELDSDGNGLGGIFNTVTADTNETAPVSASASVPIERSFAATLTKSASVPGGTADQAGEVITYTIDLTNNGTSTLTHPVIIDPMAQIATPIPDFTAPIVNTNVQSFVPIMNGDFNLGDTNQNGVWDAGETFQFAYPGDITLDGIHDPGETWVAFNLGDVNRDGIHQVGEIWAGDTNQNGIEDPGERWPFQNLGDTNGNRLQDPGETWQYVNGGDTNQNGVQDPGENWAFANIGDTNQNGVQDLGETFQFYQLGDTNRNGVQDPGETFQFNVVSTVVSVDANNDGFNDGDANLDGQLSPGETWHYTYTHTVTQAEIDNGGIVDPHLTIDNTATAVTDQANPTAIASASVQVEQKPHLTLTKIASIPDGDGDGKIDSPADDITYTFAIVNDGNMTLHNVQLVDSLLGSLTTHTETGGTGTNGDGILDVGETWTYTATYNVGQADIDNRGSVDGTADDNIHNSATVTTDQGAGATASASVPIDYRPHVTLEKDASVPGGTADHAGEVISYTIALTNDGNVTLTNPVVNDPSVSDLAAVISGGHNVGDTDQDGKLSVGETWQYTASHTVTQTEIDAGGSIANTASVVTDQGASASDSASVAVEQDPRLSLAKTAVIDDTDASGTTNAGDTIHYSFAVANSGNVSLTNVVLNDTLLGGPLGGPSAGDANGNGILDVGETWTYTADYLIQDADVTNGGVSNDATATAVAPQATHPTATAHLDLLFV